MPQNQGVNILDTPLIPQPLLPREKGRNIKFLVPLSCGRGARGEGEAAPLKIWFLMLQRSPKINLGKNLRDQRGKNCVRVFI
ncbi:MAG: hypothetical protein AUK48_14930 [Oscillatoriales cyanobacterium CG2_30_44_21]|nr:MAG: hypothetical protein AUK48_14930 [Oscillatoriales cyanobacterium CG2_30_44_21]